MKTMSSSIQGRLGPDSLPAVVEAAGHRAHPDAGQIARFMRGESPQAEARLILRHLLTGCPQCLQVTRPLWRFGDEALLRLPEAGATHAADPRSEALRQ
jgi:hypothetical protein